MTSPEFDRYSTHYEDLLKDPIRDRFAGTDGSTFFHKRKRDLILAYFRQHGVDTSPLAYLDFGCGKGILLSLLRHDFSRVAGCDPSEGMLDAAQEIEKRVQIDSNEIPFRDAEFDFVTAVCVYHHVPPAARLALTREVWRVLRSGGTFAIIEHNPYNLATRLIVGRTPVDADAVLLKQREVLELLRASGFTLSQSRYFLFFPAFLYRHTGDRAEEWLGTLPLGGQYAVFATKMDRNDVRSHD
jgi:SAM-dependent methyltransferase